MESSSEMNTICEHIKQVIGELLSFSEAIDITDLGELAKIHESGTELSKLANQLNDNNKNILSAFGKQLAKAAEDIILESCDNPEELLDDMSQAIKKLYEATTSVELLPDVNVLEKCISSFSYNQNSESENIKSQPENSQCQANNMKSQDELSDMTNNVTEHNEHAGAESTVKNANESAKKTESASNDDIEDKVTESSEDEFKYEQKPLIISEQEFEYVQSFLTECEEHIEAIETGLIELEQSPDDVDRINEVFRPFHTIKGMSGFLNLLDVQALTHELETLLDLGRKGKLKITEDIVDIIFEGLDVLKVQINEISQYMSNPTGQAIPQPPIEELLRRIRLAAKGKSFEEIKATAEEIVPKKLGQILIEEHNVSPAVVELAVEQRKQRDEHIGKILMETGAVDAKTVNQALRKQKSMKQESVVRVDTKKLDNLVNLVGELVIVQAQIEQHAAVRSDSDLLRLIEQTSKITRDVQEISMSMRMIPVAQMFHKMGRVVRDLSRKIGKKINFEIEGEETELDKNVIQELSDPLMHMIRNAVDHGIEMPEDRVQAGKPEIGTVKLRAYHHGGNIVIEIIDDGKGLDKDVILKKAIEKGLVDSESNLTESQIFNLIFAPGFSTASRITDISGRGVGMDVVKKNIEKLRGKVEIISEKGKGSTFAIKLPLTLAVIDGMVVRIGSQKFILPTLSIVRAIVPTAEQISTIRGKGQVLHLQDKLYPLINLGTLFNIPDAVSEPVKGMIVIAQAEEQQIGLVLDELLGQQQVVIKSLGLQFHDVRGISGGAILGDGTIGLIIEPASLLEMTDVSSECAA